ncbi:MurR/RpiR family transcriptional regulator [Paenibacillus sediminis]|uniref:DNA-binding MurR/RpiR family transcriptional regulator n=1 Tax=Paenibacillus sediminis TaxID=664909 RepID=A0ABS4GYC0_9BACL|nr:MurR/RpiR family transcriptional regulator [Paenibacillus sediminis]MBP1935263.1 DNA-binding MurR/RpiR family transcriptional regulator [Paenibacillus sediminis]
MKHVQKLNNSTNTLLLISSIYSSLTKAEKKVADAVQSNPEEAVLATVTDLAERAGVGETSVIRFCRALGFRGYHEFKLSVAQDLVNMPTYITGEIEESDDISAIARKITMNNETILKSTHDLLNPDNLQRAVDTILSANKIYIYGVGSSGITALDVHYRFMRLGLNVEIQRDAHIIAMSAALAKRGDVVFGISTSGSTKDLVDPIKQAKENGATIICLTSHAKSPITNYADNVLLIPSKESPFQGGSLSTKIAQIHLLDILSTLIANTNKESTIESINRTAKAVADKLY